MLCSKGAQLLQSKSLNVEEATNELIRMLLEVGETEEEKVPLAEDDKEEELEESEGIMIMIMAELVEYITLALHIVVLNPNVPCICEMLHPSVNCVSLNLIL